MNNLFPKGPVVQQGSLTIIARVPRNQVDELTKLLDVVGKDVTNGGPILNLPAVQTVHLCSFTLINDEPQLFEPSLAFECNHDGPDEACIDELILRGRDGLISIFKFCEGFSPDQLKDYLLAHRVPTAAFYIGCRGQSVGAIRNAFHVREAVQGFVDKNQAALDQLSAREVHQRIKKFLVEESPVKPITSTRTLKQQSIQAWCNVVGLGLLVLVPLLIPVVGFLCWKHAWFWLTVTLALPVWLAVLEIVLISVLLLAAELVVLLAPLCVPLLLREWQVKKDFPSLKPLKVDDRIFLHEDTYVMNHMTTMVDVRVGKNWLGTLKVVLWLIDLLAKVFFTRGDLGGIPTIHFARWLFTDNDRRLLFYSNYDGSWASYLGDFVDKANYGLTAVWSNTDRFPPAKFLFWQGAMHIEAFKSWSREHNLYTAVWYTAYDQETLWNLRNDVRFRDTVGEDLDEAAAAKLLRLL